MTLSVALFFQFFDRNGDKKISVDELRSLPHTSVKPRFVCVC